MRKNRCRRVLITLLSVAVVAIGLAACQKLESVPNLQIGIPDLNISDLLVQENSVFTSGQPSQQQLKEALQLGIKAVINLRTPSEQIGQYWSEQKTTEQQGAEYYNIPVNGIDGLNVQNAQALTKLLNKYQGKPVLVHCASGNRIGALVAIASKSEGDSIEKALAKGKQWGMTREKLVEIIKTQLIGF